MTALLVAVGGSLGALLRFLVDSEFKTRLNLTWASATLVVNIVGSFLLGVVMASGASPAVVAFAGAGVCGGFTTFSTAAVETLTHIRRRSVVRALLYAVDTLVACVAACAIGATVAG